MKKIFIFLLCAAVLNLSGVGSKLVASCDDGSCAAEEEQGSVYLKEMTAKQADIDSWIKWYALDLNQRCESGVDSQSCNEYDEICLDYPQALAPDVPVVKPKEYQLVILKDMLKAQRAYRQ